MSFEIVKGNFAFKPLNSIFGIFKTVELTLIFVGNNAFLSFEPKIIIELETSSGFLTTKSFVLPTLISTSTVLPLFLYVKRPIFLVASALATPFLEKYSNVKFWLISLPTVPSGETYQSALLEPKGIPDCFKAYKVLIVLSLIP